MGTKTAIEWTDATWSPVTGCTKVSPGCKACYAERITKRQGRDFSTVVLHPDRLIEPLSWRRPRRVFVCSMSDLFQEGVPEKYIAKVLAVCELAHRHTFQILTKRPERMRRLLLDDDFQFHIGWFASQAIAEFELNREHFEPFVHWPSPHVWLGVSAENQHYANERIPLLLQTPAAVRFVSVEPLLGPVDLGGFLCCPECGGWGSVSVAGGGRTCGLCLRRTNGNPTRWATPGRGEPGPFLDWVIVGGESGGPPERALVERFGPLPPGARYEPFPGDERHLPHEADGCDYCAAGLRFHPKAGALGWVRSIRDQCQAAGVPFLLKQWGGPTPKSGGRVLDGKIWHQFPDGEGGILDAEREAR